MSNTRDLDHLQGPPPKQRTPRQNDSLHLWCSQIADALNDAGLDIRTTLKEDFEIDWSPTLVKELLVKQTEKIMLGKTSTTELTTDEINKIYEVINRFLAKHGIHVPWPSLETLIENDRLKESKTN